MDYDDLIEMWKQFFNSTKWYESFGNYCFMALVLLVSDFATVCVMYSVLVLFILLKHLLGTQGQ